MNQHNPGIEAAVRLAHMGYRFTLDGEKIKAKYEGPGDPDPAQVQPLVATMAKHKTAVLYFLQSYCPKCGGVCFIEKWCMGCDWESLVELYPGLKIRQ